MQTQNEEPYHHHIGSQLELADKGDINVSIVPTRVEHNTEPRIEPPGEVPSRVEHNTEPRIEPPGEVSNTTRHYPQ